MIYTVPGINEIDPTPNRCSIPFKTAETIHENNDDSPLGAIKITTNGNSEVGFFDGGLSMAGNLVDGNPGLGMNYFLTQYSTDIGYKMAVDESVGNILVEGTMSENGAGSDWLLKEAMAYGAIKQLNNPPETGRKKFTGKEFDEEGGIDLSYFGARYYDPEIGVWTSTDPQEQFWSSYSYCGVDPVNYIDPYGEMGVDWAGLAVVGGFATAGGLVGGAIAENNGSDFWTGFQIGFVGGATVGALGYTAADLGYFNSALGNFQYNGTFFQKVELWGWMKYLQFTSKTARDMIGSIQKANQ